MKAIAYRKRNSKIKIVLVLLTVLAARKFLNPSGFFESDQISKAIFYALSVITFFYAYNQKVTVKHFSSFPHKAYMMIFIGMFLSVLMASLFQNQSFMVSLIAMIPYLLGYLFLYTLLKLQLTEQAIIRIIIWILCIAIVAYAINYITFPLMLFDTKGYESEVDDTRGVIRIGVPYIPLFVFGLFYSINQWLLYKKSKWLLFIGVTMLMILLSVTRQVILISALLSCWFILKHLSLAKRIAFLLLTVVFFQFVLPEIPIYQALVETSQLEIEANETKQENARIRAFRFYTDEYQTNNLTRLFGNGVPSMGNSLWGKKFENDTQSAGSYASDLGWIGFYWYFGLLATIGVFILFYKGLRKKKDARHEYLTYFCLAIMLQSIASGPILVYHQVIALMLPLYLVYGIRTVGPRKKLSSAKKLTLSHT